ncbi:2-oxoacid:ferredoxin oxidoreductase subunit beta [Porticoccus sp. W117]|uniref:2-oxoacid:ferredoxin oxidoreductase subunit beta n=1 Tax=Porticoccus sp. W117 TaxID=3054777 RepID=UPI002597259A|nr:2-oxoacid:ferredoxin oxidoreductase subunit beta [Porticoccus sp. W117]MDM3870234.1 2-oxoacid:ferredoxin oxidoreductase subunit beta [Porticoccus sp. W117]
MTYHRPSFRHPDLPTNELGHTRQYYEGALSTLCAGCGHDSVSAAIVQACFELAIEPHHVAKLSGIGCSSKTPAYFLNQAHGFNSVHGRMPSVATGANAANRQMAYIGISGDGDSASIGFGQFSHVVRRNLNMLYLVENNGCYGLTKGQDSATADVGSAGKRGIATAFEPIDLCAQALQLGATFVARSFSGDKQQLVPLLKAAITHKGFAFIDVISPCVTFNNTTTSTKSYDHMREHVRQADVVDFVPAEKEITVDYAPGTTKELTLHDGSVIHLTKAQSDLDTSDPHAALNAIHDHKVRGEVLTGLLYLDTELHDFHRVINTMPTPLRDLQEKDLCPGGDVLQGINSGLR